MVSKDHENSVERRDVLRWAGSAGSAAFLAALAGCSGTGGDGGGSSGDGGADTASGTTDAGDGSSEYAPITFWSKETQAERKQVITPMVENFDQADVSVEYVPENDMPQEISAAQASGELPNVLQIQSGTVQDLGSEGLLSKESAQTVMESIGMDDLRDGAVQLLSAPDGGHYAVPHDGWVEGLWYRKSKFEELGLSEPRTWEDIRAAAEELHDPENEQYGIGLGNETNNFARQAFTPFAISNNARVFNENGEIVFDSEEMVEAVEYYVDLTKNYGHPGKHSYDPIRQTYVNENSHMIMWSSYLMDDLVEAEMVEDTGFVPVVSRETEASYGVLNAFAITQSDDTAAQRTAEAFTEYMYQPEQYVEWLHMAPGGMQPVKQSTAESESYQDNEVLNAWGDTVSTISGALDTIQRFGLVNGQTFPEYGQIASQNLIAETITRVYEGEDAQTVVSEQADAMREAIS